MARDRYKYFRIEARELLEGLSRGLLELDRSPGDRAVVARLLRVAHTLKGAARVVQQQGIGDRAHAAEDALEPHRDQGAPPVPRERIDELLRLVDEMAAAVAALDAPPPTAAAPAPAGESPPAARSEEPIRTVRVDLHEVDAVVETTLEAGVHVASLRRQLGRLDHAKEIARALADQLSARRDGAPPPSPARLRPLVDELSRALDGAQRALDARADQAEREIGEVRRVADRLRLLPARAIAGPLERATRDAARALDRAVTFELEGGGVRVDANVLTSMREALLHAVRNAVAHGVEPAAERAARGKPASGRVRVEVERRGTRVVFRCRDDGRGVDLEAVRAAAARRGLVPAGAAAGLDDAALTALLLRGGISTSTTVTDVSGRGVGLDVVRDVAARLHAEVAVRTERGRGTEVEVVVPVSLTALTALHVEASGAVAALPLDAVRSAAFLEGTRVVRTAEGAAVAHRGALVPFVPLADVLGRPRAPGPRRAWSAVVVEAGAGRVVVGADRLVGTAEVVVRPLPAYLGLDPAVAGAALDGEGNPRLVLDPAGLVAGARRRGSYDEEEAPAPRAPILVVDDSLTTRMLEQSILESAGYEVEVAVSAEEALDKARARRFGLFLVDVEMPGMDGFEFVRVTRAEPRLAGVPAILVTSRSAQEDRERGLAAGASAYVVKGEFDQGRLLATIEELLR
ncbi:response regulator [Anaeromyxobacter sp. Fw109-5]|uniref:hybrid sensor histidine kinase/response regulator n=1 Tax=Anaeromyxobacter sp. (strain Fw109-5) TaxID=404589 RepID=UPI0000ED7456|nr:response regulator [Anaeromyxobacter sp. Fw109-5]ABS26569.1 CheA signal transduction histidine kinase [Anaeromyxobacter sp. Fw109-5]